MVNSQPFDEISQPAIDLGAVILAGGRSSRMGKDKALLELDGVNFLQRVCHVALSCTDRVYVIAPWIERYQSTVHAKVHTKVQWLSETGTDDSSHGPLVGFAQAIEQISSPQIPSLPISSPLISSQLISSQLISSQQPLPEWVLLLACDLPLLRSDVLQTWISQLPQLPPQTIAALPRHPQGWWESLCGFYHQRGFAALNQYVTQGGRSFQTWLDQYLEQQGVYELPLGDRNMMWNCNTPEDLQQLTKG